MIDNDFHPDDKGLNASQEDHWGTVTDAMRDAKRGMDIKEKQTGDRFDDDGERIPGRRKGRNDANPDRPADIQPSIGARRK